MTVINGPNEWSKIHTRPRRGNVTRHKKLGKGSFGVIFSPPLENDNYTPTSNDVVKIYNSKPIYNKAIANVEITKNIPDLAIETTPYKRQYKFRDLPEDIQLELRSRKTINSNTKKSINIYSNDKNVYMIRTPYLGHSCHDIFMDDDSLPNKDNVPKGVYKSELKSVDCVTLLKEISKCLHIIRKIINKKYIHGDIRPPNVMYNFKKNTLTIIDFDTFKEKSVYLKDEIYTNTTSSYQLRVIPIEFTPLFHAYSKNLPIRDNIKLIIDKGANYLNKIHYSYYKLLCKSISHETESLIITKDIFDKDLSKIIGFIENNDININSTLKTGEDINNIKKSIFDNVWTYMDLWGFGYSILLLCIVIYKNKKQEITYESDIRHILFILNVLITGILNPDMDNRFDIDRAIKVCDDYIGTIQTTGGKRNRKSRKPRKSRKR